jgi:hypothetical protein
MLLSKKDMAKGQEQEIDQENVVQCWCGGQQMESDSGRS